MAAAPKNPQMLADYDQQFRPSEIERNFRSILGRLSPHLCLLDVAAENFALQMRQTKHAEPFLRQQAKHFGHTRLYTAHLQFSTAQRFMHLSHIAYIFSCGDALCRQLRSHPYIKARMDPGVAPKGDFLRKTLYLLLQASSPKKGRTNPVSDSELTNVLGNASFSLVDYYRLVRNDELHAAEENGETTSDTRFGDLPMREIQKQYGISPRRPSEIQFDDVLLCSRAWQDISRRLCSQIFGVEDYIVPALRKRVGNDCGARRENGARALLRQEFLLEEVLIDDILSNLGWLAQR